MSIFDSIFGGDFRNPPRNRWDAITETIHLRLAEDRAVFFKACVDILRILPGTTIINQAMTPRIELAIAINQLNHGRDLIATRKYVKPQDGRDFLDKIYLWVCRYGSLLERDELIHRYCRWESPEEEGDGLVLFYADIASHISGNSGVSSKSSVLAEYTLRRFIIVSRLAVASTFGDKETVNELKLLHKRGM
jgi:hypothetical protein